MKRQNQRQFNVLFMVIVALCCFAICIIMNTGERIDYVMTIQTGETKHVPVKINCDGAWVDGDVRISWRER